MLSHARGVQIQWWEKCLSLTRPPTPGAVAAGGAVTSVRPSPRSSVKNPYFTTPLSVKRLEGFLRERATERSTHALACGALLRLKTTAMDARKGTRARDQTDGPRRALLRQRPPALTQKSSTTFTFLSSVKFPPRIQLHGFTVANEVFCDKRVGTRGRVSGGNSRGDIPIGTWKCVCLEQSRQ